MQSICRILLILTLMAPGLAAAADMDEMLSDAVGKFRSDIRSAKIEVDKVAIYAIEPDREGKVNLAVLQAQLEAALLESGRFKVINRAALKSLLEEQALSLTGVVDEAQMVKAGKLIGAQGFFYGSVEVQEGKVLLTMKLIEVESSAVAYSKKFAGESRAFSRLGVYWGFTSAAAGLHYEANAGGGRINPFETVHDLSNVGVSGIAGAGLTYKQGFQALRFAMLGLDLGFASVSPHGSDGSAVAQEAENVALGGGPATISIDNVAVISARLKIYMSSKEILGWEHDWLNPYAGVAFSNYTIHVRMSGAAGGGDYTELKLSHDVFVICPMVGFEVNATRALSLFAEGILVLSEAMSDDGELPYAVGDDGLWFNYSAHVPEGIAIHFGLKYYFNLF